MQQQTTTAHAEVIAELRKIGAVLAGLPLAELRSTNNRELARELRLNGTSYTQENARLVREGLLLDAAAEFARVATIRTREEGS